MCNDYGNGVLSNYEEDGMGQDSRVVRSCRFVVALGVVGAVNLTPTTESVTQIQYLMIFRK